MGWPGGSRVGRDGRVVMEWVESEGPPVDGPIEPGFGANFVVRSIEYELNGTAERETGQGRPALAPDVPSAAQRAATTGTLKRVKARWLRRAKAFNGVRILVVEDNFLAAEVVRDRLESGGCTVVGPVGRIADALQLAEHEALDGAILDVNLNGEWCFPIAVALRQRGVPFVSYRLRRRGHHTGRTAAGAELGKPVFGPQLMAVLSEVI